MKQRFHADEAAGVYRTALAEIGLGVEAHARLIAREALGRFCGECGNLQAAGAHHTVEFCNELMNKYDSVCRSPEEHHTFNPETP